MVKDLRIIVADDQERVRYGLRALLRFQPGLMVAGEAENAKQLIALVSVLEPDLVILDWNLPDMPGEKVVTSLRRMNQNLPVIVLSGQIEIQDAVLKAGVEAFVSKSSPPDQLVESIKDVIGIR
jgi:DNA-binding NarL/FixJ family response regulator